MNHVTATEEPKVLISKDSVPRFTESLVHLALLAITAYVLVLNFRNTYWSDTGAPYVNTKLEALQFAAKLYEILICTSLASTALYLLRQALWSAEGVSLGSLIASYGFGDVSTLLSPAFWAGLVAMQPRQQPRHFAFMIFLVLAIFMAAVAGPSAAIILIPQLNWWPQSYNASYLSWGGPLTIVFLDTSTTSLWPPTLNKSYLPNVDCLAPTAVLNPLCPAGGYYDIFDQTRNFNSYTWDNLDPFSLLNISMPGGGDSGTQFFRSLIVEYVPLAIASTPSQELASRIWESTVAPWQNPRFTLTGLDGYGLHKPVVQVQCQVQDTAPSLSIQFPHIRFLTPPFQPLDIGTSENINFSNIYQGQSWNVSVSSIGNTTDLEDHMRNGSLYFAWVDLSQYDPRPSIAAAIFIPSCNSSVPNQIAACSVDARWLPTDMWITPAQSQSVLDSYTYPLDLISSLAGNKELERRPLDIGIDWAQSLNLNLSESSTSMESLLQPDPTSACGINTYLASTYFEQNLASALADGLARVGYGFNLTFLQPDAYYTLDPYTGNTVQPIAAGSNSIRLDIVLSRYGYGYGINTVTKRFAAAVLLGQAAIALATVAALALSKHISSSWSSVGELVALAINSKPTSKLENTGAGVSRLDTWKEKVMVRVASGRLQIIFEGGSRLDDKDDDNDYLEPEEGKKYA
jgi:hypothetical protein